MRKSTVVISAMCVALLAAGCAKASGAKSDDAPGGDLPKIGVAIYKFDDTFMSGVRRAIEESAAMKAKVTSMDSQNSQATQNDIVDNFITQGMKSLIINPVDRTAAGMLIQKGQTAKVPIVFVNREPLKEDMAKWDKAYYVGARAQDSGRMGAEIITDHFKAHPEDDKNKDGTLQYVIIMGEPGHQDAVERTAAIKASFADSGVKTQELAEDYANWDRVKGQEKMAAFLTAYGDKIEAVLTNNDDMALGAIEALKAAGYFTSGKFMPVVGVDATAPALDAMAAGTLLGSALNDSVNQGKVCLQLAVALANGTPIELFDGYKLTAQDGTGTGNYVWIPYQKVTQDNYKQFKGGI